MGNFESSPADAGAGVSSAEKKRCMRTFLRENGLKIGKIQKAVKRYETLHNSRQNTLTYPDFCQVLHLDILESASDELFRAYSFGYSLSPDMPEERRVDMREILVGAVCMAQGDLHDKMQIVYKLYDPCKTGVVEKGDLVTVLRACYFDDEKVDTGFLAKSLMEQAAAPRGIGFGELMTAIQDTPELFFPHQKAKKGK